MRSCWLTARAEVQAATRPHRCEGRRRDRRAQPRRPWAAAGPGRTHLQHSTAGAAGVEGRRRDQRARLRCPWAVAGPGRASGRRAERSSRRGRLAGGPPPTGTQSSPAYQRTTRRPEHPWGHKRHNSRHRINGPRQKNRHPDRMSVRGGARGIRTPDLLIANETRYQLRHSPKDSNSLAPSQSATQADHRRVRHDTERELKRARN